MKCFEFNTGCQQKAWEHLLLPSGALLSTVIMVTHWRIYCKIVSSVAFKTSLFSVHYLRSPGSLMMLLWMPRWPTGILSDFKTVVSPKDLLQERYTRWVAKTLTDDSSPQSHCQVTVVRLRMIASGVEASTTLLNVVLRMLLLQEDGTHSFCLL